MDLMIKDTVIILIILIILIIIFIILIIFILVILFGLTIKGIQITIQFIIFLKFFAQVNQIIH